MLNNVIKRIAWRANSFGVVKYFWNEKEAEKWVREDLRYPLYSHIWREELIRYKGKWYVAIDDDIY